MAVTRNSGLKKLTAYSDTWPSSIVLNDMEVSLCCTKEKDNAVISQNPVTEAKRRHMVLLVDFTTTDAIPGNKPEQMTARTRD